MDKECSEKMCTCAKPLLASKAPVLSVADKLKAMGIHDKALHVEVERKKREMEENAKLKNILN